MDKATFDARGILAGKKVMVLLLVLALSAMVALPACSPNEGAGEPSPESESTQYASIEVKVVVEGYDEANLGPQEVTASVPEGSTVYDALVASGIQVNAADSDYGKFVSGIAGLEGDSEHGWVYTINGEQVMEACDKTEVAAGDSIVWSYTSW